MAFDVPSDVAIQVLVEESTGIDPTPATLQVPQEYRLRVRREVAAIRRAGGVIDVPSEYPDPAEEIVT